MPPPPPDAPSPSKRKKHRAKRSASKAASGTDAGATTAAVGASEGSQQLLGPAELPPPPKNMPARIADLIARKQNLLRRAEQSQLSLKDISDYHLAILRLGDDLLKDRTELVRKHKMTEALIKADKGREPARLVALEQRRAGLLRWEATFNEEVRALRQEEQWLHAQPAFRQASEHVRKTWRQDSAGEWFNMQEIEEDQQEIFGQSLEDMLAQMKAEDTREATPHSPPKANKST